MRSLNSAASAPICIHAGAVLLLLLLLPALIRVEPLHAEGASTISVPLRQTSPSPADAPSWRFVTGIPIPRGALADAKHVKLVDSNGNDVPAQFEPLAYWAPGRDSIQWLRIVFLAPTMIAQVPKYQLVFGPEVKAAPIANPVRVQEDDTSVSVTTGPLHFTIDKRRGGILSTVNRLGRRIYTAEPVDGPYVEDDTGAIYREAFEPRAQVVVEEPGPLRAVVRVESWHVRDLSSGTTPFSPAGVRLNKSITRYYAYAGLPCIEMEWTFVITADTKLVRFADIGLQWAGHREAQFGLDRDDSVELADGYLLQTKADEFVVRQLRGRTYADRARGTRAPGWFAIRNLAVTMRDFWQTFPRELEINQSALIVHAWPRHGILLGAIPTGFARTQDLLLDFSGESSDRIAARRELFLAEPHVWIRDERWLADSDALGPVDLNVARGWEDAAIKRRESMDPATSLGLWSWGRPGPSFPSEPSPVDGRNLHWLLYACTGHAAHLRYARAITHHGRDVGIGMNPKESDQTNLFPLLMDYYLTGNRRSLEMAGEMAPPAGSRREPGGAQDRSLPWYDTAVRRLPLPIREPGPSPSDAAP